MNIQNVFFGLATAVGLAVALAAPPALAATTTCSSTAGSSNCTARIPDAQGATNGVLTSTMTVPACATGTLSAVTATVNLTHTWIGDLQLALASPAPLSVTLLSNLPDSTGSVGGCQGDDINATFADGSAAPACGGTIPAISGTVSPASPLSAFNGASAAGVWTLTIRDTQNSGDGLLNDWSLTTTCAGPVLAVTKTVTNVTHPAGPNSAGDVLKYTITVTDTGTAAATGVTVTDPIPAGTTLVAGSTTVNGAASATAVPGPITIQSPGAPAGQINVGAANAAVVTFNVTTPTTLTTNPTVFANQASVSATNVTGAVLSDDPGTATAGDSTNISIANQPPVANNITVGNVPNAGTTSLPALQAIDPDGTIASFTITSLPPAAQGVLLVGAVPATLGQVLTPAQAATLKFTPAATFTGTSFTYTATDNFGAASNTATVTLSPGVPPVANPQALPPITAGSSTPVCFTLTGSATGATIASFTILTLPSVGTLQLSGVPVVANQVIPAANIGNLCYVPNPAQGPGAFSFTFRVTDSLGSTSAPATVSISYVNQPPVASNITVSSVPNSGTTSLPTLQAVDPDGTVASFTITSLPPAAQGVLLVGAVPATLGQVLTPAQAATLKFTPAATFTGTSFTYTATDNFGAASNTATVTLSPGVAPVANPQTLPAITVGSSTPVCFTLTGSATGGTIASFTIVTLPSVGTLQLSGAPVVANQVIPAANIGNLCYVPNPAQGPGASSFTFRVTDSLGGISAPATVSISYVAAPPAVTVQIPTLQPFALGLLALLLGGLAMRRRRGS